MNDQIKDLVARSYGTDVANRVIVIPEGCAHGFMGASADGRYAVFINPDISSSCLMLSYEDMILYFGDYTTPDILTAFACGRTVTIPHCQSVRIGYRYYNIPERSFDIKLVAEDVGYRRANNIVDYNMAIDRFSKCCFDARNGQVSQAVPAGQGSPVNNTDNDIITLYGILRSFNRTEKVILYAHEDVSHGVDNDAIRIPVQNNSNVIKFTKAAVAKGSRVTTYVKMEGPRNARIDYEVAYCRKDSTGAKSYNDNYDEKHTQEFFGSIVPKESMQQRNKSEYERA